MIKDKKYDKDDDEIFENDESHLQLNNGERNSDISSSINILFKRF